jgi:hypothetical protein
VHHECDAQIIGSAIDLPDKASRQLVELLIKI